MIQLELKVKHFIDTLFVSDCNCAIAKAAKEQFNVEKVTEGVDLLYIFDNNTEYNHEEYDRSMFDKDKAKAIANQNDPEKVIRIIELYK